MSRLKFHERPEFLKGRDGELRVAAWLQERGWYVIPSYDYSGSKRDKAPKLRGLSEGFPVPDLDVAKSGNRHWVEVKTKAAASFYRIGGTYDHGIEHYDDYMRVAAETGTTAWLAVYETETVHDAERFGMAGALLVGCMTADKGLGTPRRSGYAGKPMAYWPRDKFNHIHTFPVVDN